MSKHSSYDSFIINPVVANSRTQGLSRFTKLLAPGSLLALAHLPSDNHIFRFCCDDLSEMYYTFIVTPSRAERNCWDMPFSPWELEGFSVSMLRFITSFVTLRWSPWVIVGLWGSRGEVMFMCLVRLAAACDHMNMSFTVGLSPGPPELLSIDDHLTSQLRTRDEPKAAASLRTPRFSKAPIALIPLWV